MRSTSAPSAKGCSSSFTTFCAMAWATSSECTPCRIMANSSPPRRATVSASRTLSARRRETSTSSRSPTTWPRMSLTSLKRSRSSISTAKGSDLRRWIMQNCSSRSKNTWRLGRSVSASCRLLCSRSCSAWRSRACTWIHLRPSSIALLTLSVERSTLERYSRMPSLMASAAVFSLPPPVTATTTQSAPTLSQMSGSSSRPSPSSSLKSRKMKEKRTLRSRSSARAPDLDEASAMWMGRR